MIKNYAINALYFVVPEFIRANICMYWYGNICNTNMLIYDHVKKGDIIGEVCDNYLYLVYNKDNNFLDYTKYLE